MLSLCCRVFVLAVFISRFLILGSCSAIAATPEIASSEGVHTLDTVASKQWKRKDIMSGANPKRFRIHHRELSRNAGHQNSSMDDAGRAQHVVKRSIQDAKWLAGKIDFTVRQFKRNPRLLGIRAKPGPVPPEGIPRAQVTGITWDNFHSIEMIYTISTSGPDIGHQQLLIVDGARNPVNPERPMYRAHNPQQLTQFAQLAQHFTVVSMPDLAFIERHVRQHEYSREERDQPWYFLEIIRAPSNSRYTFLCSFWGLKSNLRVGLFTEYSTGFQTMIQRIQVVKRTNPGEDFSYGPLPPPRFSNS